MTYSNYNHVPVLIEKVLNLLNVKENGIYVDATLGMGGYSNAILNSSLCQLISIDRDPDSIIYANKNFKQFGKRFRAINGLFSNLENILNDLGIKQINGITFDFGISTPQLEDKNRGFSFLKDGPLDMRMSQSGLTAEEFLNKSEKKKLTEALKNFGEERKASKIASAIIKNRPLKSTKDFAKIIYSVLGSPKKSETNPATRSFQAIRIAINDELNEIEKGLSSSLKLLKPGGRIIAVSFHSLEDRIVKNIFSSNSYSNHNVNRHLPETKDNHPIYLKSITKKPIIPNEEEFFQNPRSRSAKLRAAERTNIPWVGENRCSMGVF